MSLYSELLSNFDALTSAMTGQRMKFKQRRPIQDQRLALKRLMKQTPEYSALHAKCKKRLDELNFLNDLSNQREIYWEMNPNPATGNCGIVQTHTYSGGGGGD